MPTLVNNAEGGSNGVLPTTGDTGSGDSWSTVTRTDASAILEYTNVWSAHGGLAYRLASRSVASAEILGWNDTAIASVFGRFYMMSDVTVGGTTRLAQFRESSAGTVGGYLELNTTGAISIRHAAEGSAYTFTNLLTLGSPYRVEFNYIPGGATCTIQARLYAMDSLSAIEDSGVVTVTPSASTTTCGTVNFGQSNATSTDRPSATGYIYLDDLAAFTPTWPGPAAFGVTAPAALPLIYLRKNR
jgi:hypothetical protein